MTEEQKTEIRNRLQGWTELYETARELKMNDCENFYLSRWGGAHQVLEILGLEEEFKDV